MAAIPAVARGRAVMILALVLLALAGAASSAPACVTGRTASLVPALFGERLQLAAPVAVARTELPLGPEHPGAILHMYRPSGGAHPALLVSLGIEPAPPDDPRVVGLLEGLARDGIVAGLLESPDLNEGRLTAAAPDLLVSAFEAMRTQPFIAPGHVGLLGLSVGGSLALIAAADPRIAADVRLVEAVGAYDSLITLSRSVITESEDLHGRPRPWQPAPLPAALVPTNLIDLLAAPSDRIALEMAVANPGLAPASTLSPSGLDILRLLTAADVDSFDAAVRDIPPARRQTLDALSPDPFLSQIRAPVYLMVDNSDTFVPPTESAAIAVRLRGAGARVYFSNFDIFRHVEPGGKGSPLTLSRDLTRLLLHVCAVLSHLQS